MSVFRTSFGENLFNSKYAATPGETWEQRARTMVHSICSKHLTSSDYWQLFEYIRDMKFIPGGRYIYYAGRSIQYINNCFLLRAEHDTREEWSSIMERAASCLMVGGGIGIDYSRIRPSGKRLRRTGGISSGPLSLMKIINEIGREVMQGGSRRSAIYGSLLHTHEDIHKFLYVKSWDQLPVGYSGLSIGDIKREDFDFHAPLDMTNISVNYDNVLYESTPPDVFIENCKQAMRTGEPGFSFNCGEKENETLRNACTELTSSDDSDVCNLGSINLSRITDLTEFKDVVWLATKFLLCGTIVGDLPYEKVYRVRERNRRLGLGIMGLHEWLLKRGYNYSVPKELHEWLHNYVVISKHSMVEFCNTHSISESKGIRAIAPTGTIGSMAGTTTGIEPIYSVAFKRRYLTKGNKRNYEYVVEPIADYLIKEYGIDPTKIETSIDLAKDWERRISVQKDIQAYVDHAISSTINLPAWGTEFNNESRVQDFAKTLWRYAPHLRGFTCYPDGSRGGQPLSSVPYQDAIKHKGVVFEEQMTCAGGICSL